MEIEGEMMVIQYFRVTLFSFAVVCASICCAGTPRAESFAEFVDPMIGTGGTGHAFPGPCRPFGMVQPSLDTGNGSWKYCSGYSGEDRVIRRF